MDDSELPGQLPLFDLPFEAKPHGFRVVDLVPNEETNAEKPGETQEQDH